MQRQLRAIVFDDNESIRNLVKRVLEDRGYEVLIYTDPTECPLQHSHECQCDETQVCSDIVISDIDMPNVSGLEYVEQQLNKGCKVPNIAIMSGLWSESRLEQAKALGCKTFEKPFALGALTEWLKECESRIDPDKSLSDWFLRT
jgi:CheY-like chemotaxis protein